MDSRRIDYLAGRPTTFLMFTMSALRGASRLIASGIMQRVHVDAVLDGVVEARAKQKAGKLHYERPEYMAHVVNIAQSLDESFWESVGLGSTKPIEDSLAQMVAAGHA